MGFLKKFIFNCIADIMQIGENKVLSLQLTLSLRIWEILILKLEDLH